MNSPEKPKRGFALLTVEQRKAIASKGGRSCFEQGKSRQWTKEEAVAAGRKGGIASRVSRKAGQSL